MRAKHVKEWLRGIVEEEDPKGQGNEGKGANWELFVQLVQAVWTHGIIPRQMLWSTVVLIPKGGGDYRGIGLLGKCLSGLWTTNSMPLSCLTASMAVARTVELAPG